MGLNLGVDSGNSLGLNLGVDSGYSLGLKSGVDSGHYTGLDLELDLELELGLNLKASKDFPRGLDSGTLDLNIQYFIGKIDAGHVGVYGVVRVILQSIYVENQYFYF